MTEFKKLIKDAGVVGAGGAGFPTDVKFANNIETILINATECEPLLKTDFYLLKEYKSFLEETLSEVVKKVGAKKGVIGLKKHNGILLGIADQTTVGNIIYKLVPDVYPSGDEIILIKEALDLNVPAGNLPIAVGVVVLNVETLLNIGNAMKNKGVYEKYLTVGGKTEKTYVLKVPIGTPVSTVFDNLGINIPADCSVVDGGPIMGNIVNPNTAVVTKTTKGLLIIDNNTLCISLKKRTFSNVTTQASSNCCGCRMCTDLCPRYLMGYPIEPHKIVASYTNKIADTQTFMGAFYCSDCGVCRTVACPQNIMPSLIFQRAKNELIKNGVSANIMKSTTPIFQREYRRVPTQRIMIRLGVGKYFKDDYEYKEMLNINKVFIPLKQHIGAAAESIVKVNDKVTIGQTIAKPKEKALSTSIKSSINGTVYSVNESNIIILSDNKER